MIRIASVEQHGDDVSVRLSGLDPQHDRGLALIPDAVIRQLVDRVGSIESGPYRYVRNSDGTVTIKTALYWADRDRKYKATHEEIQQKRYYCPRDGREMIPTSYKRESGKSIKLLGCRKCLFLIRAPDIIGHHNAVPDTREEV